MNIIITIRNELKKQINFHKAEFSFKSSAHRTNGALHWFRQNTDVVLALAVTALFMLHHQWLIYQLATS